MTTIAKTRRYAELDYRHMKLVQLYSVMSELRLHTNKAVNTDTAEYYHAKLYTWSDFSPFLVAGLESMMQVFYIEIDGFIGAFWNSDKGEVQQRDNENAVWRLICMTALVQLGKNQQKWHSRNYCELRRTILR